MNESFNKFKKKILLEALIKSIVISLCVGIICFTVPYLIVTIKEITYEIKYLYYVIIGTVSLSLIIFGLLFLILYPRNLKVAKRLDKELNLKQKVQTMVEYENVDTPMTNLQREDTLNILGSISLKNFVMKFSVFFFILVGFASVLGVTSIVFAAIEDDKIEIPPVIEVPNYDLDNWTVRMLLDLIEYVESSNIDNELKTPVVNDLNNLLDTLENVEYESDMKELVKKVIDDASLKLDLINTNNELFTVLRTSSSSVVKDLGLHINTLNVSNLTNSIENLYVYITGDSKTVLGAIQEFDNDFRVLLKNSTLNKEEKLFSALYKLGEDLKACENASNVNESVLDAINNNKTIIIDIVKKQSENKIVIEYVIKQLETIFGLNETNGPIEGDETGSNDNINNTEPPKINDDDQSGGYGSGDIDLGSDDLIFDIEEGIVKYGDVIAKYYGDIVGKFNDGTLPEEYKEFFDKYYDLLFGFEEETETGEN